jgi:hypothetical protein
MLYFTANPNGEAEVVNVQLKPHAKLKKLQFDEDFAVPWLLKAVTLSVTWLPNTRLKR